VTTVYNAGGDGYLSKLVETNFDQRYRVHCAILLGQEKRADEEDAETFCDPANDHNEFKQLAQYRLQLAAYKALVTNLTEKRPHLLVALQALMAFLQIAIVAAPLSAALWLSFNITLRLLSRITASKLSLFLLVTLDVLVALLMPPLVTSFMTCVLVGGAVFAFGELPDFFAFQSANWFTLTVGGALFMTSFNFILPTLIALVALMLPTTWGILLAVAMLFIAPIIVAVYRGLEFFTDVGKVVGLDWGIGPISTAINWAIFLDLLFSITFLAPSLALVLANRNKSTRKIFLNFAMWIHDHQKGPFIAISEILTSIPKVFGGK
jgi:hypothetical protein